MIMIQRAYAFYELTPLMQKYSCNKVGENKNISFIALLGYQNSQTASYHNLTSQFSSQIK